ncbi:MAG TPA: hypothetical protein PLQ68_04570 [Clostridia bacterium]|nr:hypothetical protein [Clostridia bacterium]
MAKPYTELTKDFRAFIIDNKRREAEEMVSEVIAGILPFVPIDTGRLVNSGFGYVDGDLVVNTNHGTSTSKLPIIPPEPPEVVVDDPASFQGNIIFTTPKPATRGATVFYVEGGQMLFDYAPFVMGGLANIQQIITPSIINILLLKAAKNAAERIKKKWRRSA